MINLIRELTLLKFSQLYTDVDNLQTNYVHRKHVDK